MTEVKVDWNDYCEDRNSFIAKIYFLLDTFHLYGSDGAFTFPDGDTYYKDKGHKSEPQLELFK